MIKDVRAPYPARARRSAEKMSLDGVDVAIQMIISEPPSPMGP
jgi:hypothetical protein